MWRSGRAAAVLAGLAVLGAGAAAGAGLAGCSGASGRADGRLNVVASFYPLQFVAERVGGERVHVENLVKPGTEPHDMELQPRQVAAITDADLVLYLGGFQPAVDDVAGQQPAARTLDVTAVTTLLEGGPAESGDGLSAPDAPAESGRKDPHVWLDPTRLGAIAAAVADRLARVDPEHTNEYRGRAKWLATQLTTLDEEFVRGLSSCARRDIVTSHAAFGYLAQRYHLRQIAVTGLSPEEEASPGRLAEVARTAWAAGATTIFFETLVNNRVAETVAEEVGAKTAVLDPIEGIRPGSSDDYFSIMRANLTTLRSALGCS